MIRYLGTYFPRSVAESFLIFDSLLNCKKYEQKIRGIKPLKICSIGAGTGGDVVGLLFSLGKRLAVPIGADIEIFALEGNPIALEIARETITRTCNELQFKLSFFPIRATIPIETPLFSNASFLSEINGPFDFITCSKALNEMDSGHAVSKPYQDFCSTFAPKLSSNGLMLLLDVTSRTANGNSWIPTRLNNQVCSFALSNSEYRTALPLLCSNLESSCKSNECYSQQEIYISHSRKTRDCSKFCYRVIGRNSAVDELVSSPSLWESPIARDNSERCKSYTHRQ